MTMSSLLGVNAVRLGPHADLWETSGIWNRENGFLTFEAQSTAIPAQCRAQPTGIIEFPTVIQGAHEFRVDGHLVQLFGDRTFRAVDRFYGRPILECDLIANGTRLTWKVSSFADYFARITDLPRVTESQSSFNLFAETFHAVAAGAMIIMAIYTLFLFYGPVSIGLTLSVFLSCVLMAIYFLGCASHDFGIHLDMLTMHKYADISLWFGLLTLFNAYRLEGMITSLGLGIYIVAGLIGTTIILMGRTGDEVQLGTTIPCVTAFLNILSLTLRARIFNSKWYTDGQRTLQLFSLIAYLAGLTWEMSVITGLLEAPPLLPLTQVGGVLFLIFSVNQRIRVTYQERDHLRKNLQAEVDLKTGELTQAMSELKSTQAELVQSAKLASLGTLSAGIAHEINNSLNYVNGAIYPLQKLVQGSAELKDNPKVARLFTAMTEGMRLSIEIIASLRNYTGLNQAKFNDLRVLTVVKSVLVILKSRLNDKVEVEVDIPEHLTIFGSVVGLNQVFMNLITNAVDAMPDQGRLSIRARDRADYVDIVVSDTGGGIPQAVIDRIFEPFFTTKQVGKGTGLGLHIVKTEMEKHKGKVVVESTPAGTTFTLSFTKNPDDLRDAEDKAA